VAAEGMRRRRGRWEERGDRGWGLREEARVGADCSMLYTMETWSEPSVHRWTVENSWAVSDRNRPHSFVHCLTIFLFLFLFLCNMEIITIWTICLSSKI
jgi:hypothetical protein